MAKKKSENKKPKTNSQKLARQAGKVAAKAELAATEALNRARATSAFLIDLFTHPGEFVGAAVNAGQGTINQLGVGVNHLLGGQVPSDASASEILDSARKAVEDRLKSTVSSLSLPSRDEYDTLKKRVAELEAQLAENSTRKALKPAPKAAAKPAAKAAAKPAAKGAAKPASKPAAKPVAKAGTKPATRPKASASPASGAGSETARRKAPTSAASKTK